MDDRFQQVENKLNTDEQFEAQFEQQTSEMKQRRREYYKAKGEDRAPDKIPGENTVYQARQALKTGNKSRKSREGFILRTFRLLKQLHGIRKNYSDRGVYSCESVHKLRVDAV